LDPLGEQVSWLYADKLASLERRAEKASPVAGASGDPIYAATGIVDNHRVRVVLQGYDKRERRYEISATDGSATIAKTKADAIAFISGESVK
jgi:hypothetical protein